jgi:diacylglycerol kinase (ATP)
MARKSREIDPVRHGAHATGTSPGSDFGRTLRSRGVQWTAVVNPSAGRGRTHKLLGRLSDAFSALGVDVHVSSDAADACSAARDAFTRGHGVVACGGDGTVAELAGEAARADAPLALVPTGAGNDFARHLDIDHRHPLESIDLLRTGRLALADLGRARAGDGAERVFTTVANAGFDAEANRWANTVSWLSGTPLYVLAVLRTLAVYRPTLLEVRVGEEVWRGNARLVAVGNARGYGGGMKITPGAAVDDGVLDVCVVGALSRTRFLATFTRVFSGHHVTMRDVTTLRGPTVEISSTGHQTSESYPMELWASGERVGPLPGRIEVWPAALKVIVPTTSTLPAPAGENGRLS